MSFDQANFEDQEAEIRAAFKRKDEEIAALKHRVSELEEIFRHRGENLEIRMSFRDFHIKEGITARTIDDVANSRFYVAEIAKSMYEKIIDAYEKARSK